MSPETVCEQEVVRTADATPANPKNGAYGGQKDILGHKWG